MATVPTQIRIDENLKKQAAELFAQLGLDMSSAINIFLRQSVLHGGLPFRVELPSQQKTEPPVFKAEKGNSALMESEERAGQAKAWQGEVGTVAREDEAKMIAWPDEAGTAAQTDETEVAWPDDRDMTVWPDEVEKTGWPNQEKEADTTEQSDKAEKIAWPDGTKETAQPGESRLSGTGFSEMRNRMAEAAASDMSGRMTDAVVSKITGRAAATPDVNTVMSDANTAVPNDLAAATAQEDDLDFIDLDEMIDLL